MRKKISKFLVISLIVGMCMNMHINVFAAMVDPNIPDGFYALDLNTDGMASFTPPTYTTTSVTGQVISKWKKFEAQLLKRVTTISPGTTTYVYTYKTTGSIKSCPADENEIELHFPSAGFYQFQIRGVNLEGNYTNWVKISSDPAYEGLPISEDDLSISGSGTGSGSSSYNDTNSGPGVVQTSNIPAGYQYVLGPNGEILYYNNAANQYNGQYYGIPGVNQYNQNGNQYLGPGYVSNNGNSQAMTPNTGVYAYQQVQSPYTYVGGQMTQNQGYGNGMYNPNYSDQNMQQTNNNYYAVPQITQGMEVGWHVDNNGRFYYQGNGVVLKGTWYFIDGSYYRFADSGYILCNQWFKDNNTGYWYYLAGDGRMLTGWQCINGTWYYFKPQNGNGYGTMYANTSFYIEDIVWGNGQYAFDTNGAMVRNAWYGGYYYNNDGRRAN